MSGIARFLRWLRPRLWMLVLPVSILWLEAVLHAALFRSVWGRGLLYVPLFSTAIALLLDFFCSLCPPRACRRLTGAFLAVITFWYMVQTVYCTVSTTFLTLYSVGTGTGPITQFWREILLGVWQALPVLLFEAVPFALYLWRGRRLFPEDESTKARCRRLLLSSAAFHLAALLLLLPSFGSLMTPRFLYYESFIPELTVANFGVLTTLRLDAKQLIFGKSVEPPLLAESSPEPSQEPPSAPSPTPSPPLQEAIAPLDAPREYNAMDIDFQALAEAAEDDALAAMHSYFGSRQATAKNAYTGAFQGKNLIVITAESLSPYAIDEERTPTLYRLSQEGFQFEHFYTPLWWVSTSDGEYAICQSLIPEAGTWSMSQSSANELPFTLGNQFRRQGYGAYAYHDHFYDYYDRDASHPNMGYDYKGRGNGLELSDLFPESDVEMMELSIPEYVDKAPFHVYYMTVSGHMNYTFLGNAMSAKHEAEVANLDLSEEARAYLACNIELDRAVELLLERLDEAGVLEDTVLCITPDHYPYGLSKDALDELAGHEVEENFELYQSTLILWSADLPEPVAVHKPCSSLDILPTLSNLFGLEYDSRLLMGRDILSDSEALVAFSNRSFITDHGRYNARTDVFTPYDDEGVVEGYAQSTLEQVNDMFLYSEAILETDYYRKLDLFDTGLP